MEILNRNRILFQQLGVGVGLNVSSDTKRSSSDLKLFHEIAEDSAHLQYKIVSKKPSGMVDNWNGALSCFNEFDYCYLLHDDDSLTDNFFKNVLVNLLRYKPSMLQVNSSLDFGHGKVSSKTPNRYSRVVTGKEYLEHISKDSFPAPSEAIFKSPPPSAKNIYTNLMGWCPEVKLYLDTMAEKEATYVGLSSIAVVRGISEGQVSHNTEWKGAVDSAVLGGVAGYGQYMTQLFTEVEAMNRLDQYFQLYFGSCESYQRENLNLILDFVSKNHLLRFF